MLLNERWLFLGDTESAADRRLTVFRAFPGCWWIASRKEMIGPLDDRSILRAVRVACTLSVDGCELGPPTLSFWGLAPRRPFEMGPKWQSVTESELPPSVTTYDREALEPVSGCCTTFDAMPKVAWGSMAGWEEFLEQRPARGGRLIEGWNVHPEGSLVFTYASELEAGFVVVDLAEAPPQ